MALHIDRVMIAGNLAAQHFQSDEPAFYTPFFLCQQRITSDEFAFFELHDRTESGLEKACSSVHVISIEKHFGLEPEGIAGSETSGQQTRGYAGLEYSIPNGF